jgi:hypothetical protein
MSQTIYVPFAVADCHRHITDLMRRAATIRAAADKTPDLASTLGAIRDIRKLTEDLPIAVHRFKKASKQLSDAHESARIKPEELLAANVHVLDSAHDAALDWALGILAAAERTDDRDPAEYLDWLRRNSKEAVDFWNEVRTRLIEIRNIDQTRIEALMMREAVAAGDTAQANGFDIDMNGYEQWEVNEPPPTLSLTQSADDIIRICDEAMEAFDAFTNASARTSNQKEGFAKRDAAHRDLQAKIVAIESVVAQFGWEKSAMSALHILGRERSPDFYGDVIVGAERELTTLRYEAIRRSKPQPAPAPLLPAPPAVFLEYHSANYDDPGDFFFFEVPDEASAMRMLELLRCKFPSREQNFRSFRMHAEIVDPVRQHVIRERIQLIGRCADSDHVRAMEGKEIGDFDIEHYTACRNWEAMANVLTSTVPLAPAPPPSAAMPAAATDARDDSPEPEIEESDSDEMTVTRLSKMTGVAKGVISRAANNGEIETNGKTGPERRLKAASASRWHEEYEKRNSKGF